MQYAPTRVREKFDGFHISAHGCTENPSGFTSKPSSRGFSGRMLLRPYTGTCKTRPVLGLNRRRETFSGRMLLRPTRVRAKFGEF